MFEQVADQDDGVGQDPVAFLAAAVEMLAKLPSELWRTGNDGLAGIAAGLDALAVQVDCARVALVAQAESRGVVDQSPCPVVGGLVEWSTASIWSRPMHRGS